METEELAAEGEGASVNKFWGVVISEPVGGVGPCNPVSGEAEAWLLESALTVFGGDLQVSTCVQGKYKGGGVIGYSLMSIPNYIILAGNKHDCNKHGHMYTFATFKLQNL